MKDILAHHGVKGMKWGVRNDGSSSTAKRSVSEDVQAVREAKSKIVRKHSVGLHNTDALSNAELQRVVTRMNLEVQYSNLTKQKRNNVTADIASAKTLGKGVKAVATSRVTTAVASGIHPGLGAATAVAQEFIRDPRPEHLR